MQIILTKNLLCVNITLVCQISNFNCSSSELCLSFIHQIHHIFSLLLFIRFGFIRGHNFHFCCSCATCCRYVRSYGNIVHFSLQVFSGELDGNCYDAYYSCYRQQGNDGNREGVVCARGCNGGEFFFC